MSLDRGKALVSGSSTLQAGGAITSSTAGSEILFGDDVALSGGSLLRMFKDLFAVVPPQASFASGVSLTATESSIVDLDHRLNLVNGMAFAFVDNSQLKVDNLNIGFNGNLTGSVGSLVVEDSNPGVSSLVVDEGLTIGHPTDGTGLLKLNNATAQINGATGVGATGTIEIKGSSRLRIDDMLIQGGALTSENVDNPLQQSVGSILTVNNNGQVSVDGNQEIRTDGVFNVFSGADFNVTQQLTVGADPVGMGTLFVHGDRLYAHGRRRTDHRRR